ncbi:fibrinogen-like protein 1 [Drosophila navojoa]|uniref:fibrinogen-like protein 1 n=1 Tax=Drosophila navojoa TaxID=7232 RepID=UPI0008471953|nr:fibrinogen-like protein 1 [Drosophila navojoa]
MSTYSSIFKYYIWLCIVLGGRGAIAERNEVKVRIDQLEELIQTNNEGLLQLESNWNSVRNRSTAQIEAHCDSYISEQKSWLSACEAKAKAASVRLKESEDRSGILLQNLTSCRINLAYDAELEEYLPQSCLPFGSATGLYRIKLPGQDPFYVPCDARFAGSGWLVIQRRMDGSVDFYRNWTEYRAGFGSLSGEFFLGLEKLHRLTALRRFELFVYLEDFEGEVRYAHYDNFSVGSEESFYQLQSLGEYEGTAGNSMALNVLQRFSTADKDNDTWQEGSCARRYHSAWWYASCSAFCNPNGKYFKRRQLSTSTRGKGIIWHQWHGFEETLKFVQLMIRPISASV